MGVGFDGMIFSGIYPTGTSGCSEGWYSVGGFQVTHNKQFNRKTPPIDGAPTSQLLSLPIHSHYLIELLNWNLSKFQTVVIPNVIIVSPSQNPKWGWEINLKGHFSQLSHTLVASASLLYTKKINERIKSFNDEFSLEFWQFFRNCLHGYRITFDGAAGFEFEWIWPFLYDFSATNFVK